MGVKSTVAGDERDATTEFHGVVCVPLVVAATNAISTTVSTSRPREAVSSRW